MRWGAQMYREGIVKGAIFTGIGMTLGIVAGAVKELYFDTRKKNSNNEDES